jgi:hypothetical protein
MKQASVSSTGHGGEVVLRVQFNRAIATDLERSNKNARHAAGGGRGEVLHRPPALMRSRGAE